MRLFFAAVITVLIPFSGYPQSAIREIRVNNKVFDPGHSEKIFIDSPDQWIMIEFEPDGQQYAYRIGRLDTSWTTSSYPVLNLFGLNSGNHVLEFKSVSEDGSSTVTEVLIEVKQAFWQKWWFWPSILLYSVFVAGIAVYLFFLYDLRQKLKMQHVRNRIASDLHDEVGSNLNSIAIYAELLRKKNGR
ncbi:MAG: histidine kinase dimerization/phosphoacceptor domain-containing protein [Leadbetterella sp.]|nr:histidine kinase dimerization/phosphoacceptor domain-containing protein [Leadbetterella sp.]